MTFRSTMIFGAVAVASLTGGALAATQAGRPLSATLNGAAERPGPGDTDGTGTAELRVNAGQNQICYTLKVSNIDTATMAHIHRAPPTQAGPPVVTLKKPIDGTSSGCASVARSLAQAIIRNPGAYYVNVHTTAFANGAIRGQLSK
jgi:hypothetical protein